jgi:hypothetical protein
LFQQQQENTNRYKIEIHVFDETNTLGKTTKRGHNLNNLEKNFFASNNKQELEQQKKKSKRN